MYTYDMPAVARDYVTAIGVVSGLYVRLDDVAVHVVKYGGGSPQVVTAVVSMGAADELASAADDVFVAMVTRGRLVRATWRASLVVVEVLMVTRGRVVRAT